jgi:DNA-binding NtrC family response regulator
LLLAHDSADSSTLTPDPTPRQNARILVVDDEEAMRHFLRKGLQRLGYAVEIVADGDAAITHWTREPVDVAVVDLKMPGTDGLAVLSRIRAADPQAAIVLMTAHGTIATAVEAMQAGACDFVTKPFGIEELALRIERALELRGVREPQPTPEAGEDRMGLVGDSAAMCSVRQLIELVRDSETTVLITGASGTGKSLTARALHTGSRRAKAPFVALNCAALPDTLVESELFGYEIGAFTGARQRKQGRITMADKGTLFLDDVSELSPTAQAKIARFLQDREVLPLGGSVPTRVDVRVVAATNRDLVGLVSEGKFRAELLWSLEVVRIHLPSLHERREDVPLLVAHHLRRIAARQRGRQQTMTADAMASLTAHDWPGNVRELENVVERMAVLAGSRQTLGTGDLPAELRASSEAPSARGSYHDATTEFDRAFFSALLLRCHGNVSEAARMAGLSRGHLHRRIQALGLDPDRYR